jgi:hypothetical protein
MGVVVAWIITIVRMDVPVRDAVEYSYSETDNNYASKHGDDFFDFGFVGAAGVDGGQNVAGGNIDEEASD